MKYGHSTVDLDEGHDTEQPHKMDGEGFENDVTKAKAILQKVSRFTFHGYYLACFSKSNINSAYGRRFVTFRS